MDELEIQLKAMREARSAIIYAESRLGSLVNKLAELDAELKRFREREPLVQAVFTAIVGNADSFYNTEFSPAAIAQMRACITPASSAAAGDESA